MKLDLRFNTRILLLFHKRWILYVMQTVYLCMTMDGSVTLHCVSGEFRDKTLVKKSNSVFPVTTAHIDDVL